MTKDKYVVFQIPPRYAKWSLDDYPEKVRDRISGWLDGPAWSLYIFGGLGTRKTSLAAAIVKHFRRHREHGVQGTTFTPIEKMIHYSNIFEEEAWYLRQCAEAPLWVLDDLGGGMRTEWRTDQMMRILRHRYDHNMKTVITGNLSLDDVATKINERLADRLREGEKLFTGSESKRIPPRGPTSAAEKEAENDTL